MYDEHLGSASQPLQAPQSNRYPMSEFVQSTFASKYSSSSARLRKPCPSLLSTRTPISATHHNTPLGRLGKLILIHIPNRILLRRPNLTRIRSTIAPRNQDISRLRLHRFPLGLLPFLSRRSLEPLILGIVLDLLRPRPLQHLFHARFAGQALESDVVDHPPCGWDVHDRPGGYFVTAR
jgi:hypothetical protein